MKDLSLPEPIEVYFEADSRDAHAVARCFTTEGIVVDEGRTHAGPTAIEAWKIAASAQYSYVAEPFALEKGTGGSGLNWVHESNVNERTL